MRNKLHVIIPAYFIACVNSAVYCALTGSNALEVDISHSL